MIIKKGIRTKINIRIAKNNSFRFFSCSVAIKIKNKIVCISSTIGTEKISHRKAPLTSSFFGIM